MTKGVFIFIALLVLAAVVTWTLRQECYNGDIHPWPFTGPVDKLQTGVSEEGYPITCDGKVHPDSNCAMMYWGLCINNASRGTP